MTHRNLLLLSSSKYRDTGYLDHAMPTLRAFLAPGKDNLLFIPFANAAKDYDQYEAKVARAFDDIDLRIQSIHHAQDPVEAVALADAIIIGGGNTFALLQRLQEARLLVPIKKAIDAGASYVGWSAGSNIACPTICTTNDMPICEPKSFDALGLIPFQINPHYISGKIGGHNGESREQRLSEFLMINPGQCVLAMPEGTALLCQHSRVTLGGEADGILMTAGGHKTIRRGEVLEWLLTSK